MIDDSGAVGIVVDRAFGHRVLEAARTSHVWVVESEDNVPVIKAAWSRLGVGNGGDPPAPGVTSFASYEGESPEEMCARILPVVDEHHGGGPDEPGWAEIRVYGVEPTRRLRAILEMLGATEYTRTEDGFVARRSR